MWNVIEIAAIIVECFLALWFNVGYFQFKDKRFCKIKIAAEVLILSIWDYIGSMVIKQEFLAMAGFSILLFAFSALFLKKTIPEKLIIAIISCTMFYLVNLPILYVFSITFHQTAYEMTISTGPERIVILFLTKIFYFAITQFILYMAKRKMYYFKNTEWVLVISDFFITLIIAFFLYSLSIDLWNKLYVYIVIVVLLSILDIIAYEFMKKINKKNSEEIENELLRLSLNQQSEMIDKIREQYETVSEVRHNYVHELTYIQGVIDEGNYEKLENYIKTRLSSEQLNVHNYIFSSNKVIDSVLNFKFAEAKQQNINIVCKLTAEIPESIERDITLILSNLLDNAIEASKKIVDEQPEIDIDVTAISGYYSILVRNKISTSVLKKNSILATSKKNKSKHGFGLKSVRALAAVHNGMFDIYEKNNYFVVKVLLSK